MEILFINLAKPETKLKQSLPPPRTVGAAAVKVAGVVGALGSGAEGYIISS